MFDFAVKNQKGKNLMKLIPGIKYRENLDNIEYTFQTIRNHLN